MLISIEFGFYLYLFGGCRQFRVPAILWVARLMSELSTLNRRATSLPEIDKVCVAI